MTRDLCNGKNLAETPWGIFLIKMYLFIVLNCFLNLIFFTFTNSQLFAVACSFWAISPHGMKRPSLPFGCMLSRNSFCEYIDTSFLPSERVVVLSFHLHAVPKQE